MADSFVDRFLVTLADGVERELNYTMGSLIWLAKNHRINLPLEMAMALTESTPAAEREKIVQAKLWFIQANLDVLVQAGIMDADSQAPVVSRSLVSRMLPIEAASLIMPVFKAITVGLNAKRAPKEGEQDPNAAPAAA